MDFTSSGFLIFVVAVTLLFHANASAAYRSLVLSAANLVFIGSYVTHVWQLLPLVGFLVLGYAAVELARRRQSSAVVGGGVAIVVSVFVILKRYSFLRDLPLLQFAYLQVGLSYILFRILHMIIDAGSGEFDKRVGVREFLDYNCNFLSFVSGPIQRFQDFSDSRRNLSQAAREDLVFEACRRLVTGYFKVCVVSAIADHLFEGLKAACLSSGEALSWLNFTVRYLGAVATYTAYLYYNFSGYMDVVIGIGALLGQQLPENFNRPFSARSFLEFWTRWHMTLSDWFKLYLFNPLVGFLVGKFPSRALGPYIGVAAYFVTFLVMGTWHGTTIVFLIYGLLMGAGASINKLWQVWLMRRMGTKGYRKLGDHPAYAYLCRGMNSAYFCMAVTCLWVDLGQMTAIVKAIGAFGLLAAFALFTLCSVAVFLVQDLGGRLLSGKGDGIAVPRGFIVGNLGLAVRILVILSVMSFFHKSPEFVYKAF